jgi:hypothetical protein
MVRGFGVFEVDIRDAWLFGDYVDIYRAGTNGFIDMMRYQLRRCGQKFVSFGTSEIQGPIESISDAVMSGGRSLTSQSRMQKEEMHLEKHRQYRRAGQAANLEVALLAVGNLVLRLLNGEVESTSEAHHVCSLSYR